MRKFLLIIIILLLIGTISSYLVYRNAPYLLAKLLSKKIDVPIHIRAVHFYRNKLIINGLEIFNPRGARTARALKVETITITNSYSSYFRNPIIIDQIHLDQVYVNIEIYNQDRTAGNWHTIMNNMEKGERGFFSIEREAIIKNLLFTNIYINLFLPNKAPQALSPIQQLAFTNVSSKKGIPIQEISQIIIQHMIHSIFLEKGIKALFQIPEQIIKGVLPFFGMELKKQEETSYNKN